MVYFLFILLILIFHSAEIAPANDFSKNYLSKENTNAVKGIFVILILFSHYSQYVTLSGPYDEPYLILKGHLHQMVVAMFWFYSGYGIMESISRKGFSYVKSIMTRRFLTVLINFDFAVILFLLVKYFLGVTYSLPRILTSLIGWTAVGNSNWYIFVTLVLYILTFLSFYLLRWSDSISARYTGGILMVILSCLFVYYLMKSGAPTRYYNTTLLFPLGLWYSLLRRKTEAIIMKNDYTYTFVCLSATIIYCISYTNRGTYGLKGYTIWAFSFTSLIILATMKITFRSHLLTWFGNHVFSVYILQRISMMLLKNVGLGDTNKYMFLILSILATIFLAMIFDYATGRFWSLLFKKSYA